MAASSSSSSAGSLPTLEHDVFLSFRGEDTRHNFTGHLFDALCRNQINAYIDDKGLERGDEISRALKEAIERSKISVVIFSKDYASSSWCLDELLHILHCHKTNNQIVLPVFYDVDPSDVRKQKGSYHTALEKHGDNIKVDRWRDALTTAANLAGWDLQVIKSECELVNKIVKDILKRLDRISARKDFTSLVGIDKRVKNIEDALCIGSSEVRMVGIWGTGGIGKTTLARVIFHRLSSKFEACCFLEDITVDWDKGQKKYYDSKNTLFDPKRLHGKRVLIVLDNVVDREQLKILAGDCNSFCQGSRIIITSRDMQMLRGEVDKTYKVESLDFEEAVQLFYSNTLKQKQPTNDYPPVLLERIINYAEGIPLALEVLSSFLHGKKRENWEDEMNKLKDYPNKKIFNILRTSYDALDKMQKCIFLDIACFFKDMFRDDVERILDACGLHPKVGIDDLIDKSLISIKIDNKLWMHDLIQQMAWDIVKSTEDVKSSSRLWIPQDARHILETKRGSAAVEGIFLDMSKIDRINFNPVAFEEMHRLRLLKIFHSHVHKQCSISVDRGNLLFLPHSLRYLHWEKYPWKSFPPSFKPENLVELNLPYSEVKQLWKGTQPLGSLKKIDLSHSKNLTKLPDLSQASNLELLYLEHCTSLRQVPSSIQHLGKLKTLVLDGCSSLNEFPKLPKSIVCLVLGGTAIEQVPPSIQSLECIEILNLSGCRNLVSLPSFIPMQSLKALILPETLASRKQSWIYRVFNRPGNPLPEYSDSEYGTSHVYPCQPIHYVKRSIRLRSKDGSSPELPLYKYLFCGRSTSVEVVSISRTGLSKCLANGFGHQGQNLLFFNCIEFEGGNSNIDLDNKLKLHSTFIELRKFTREFHNEADVGYCCPGDKIPNWFHYQSNKDSIVDASLQCITTMDSIVHTPILGFALCAIVNFSDNPKGSRNIPWLYGDGYKKLSLLCELTYQSSTGEIVEWDRCFYKKNVSLASFRFWAAPDENIGCSAEVIGCGVHILRQENPLYRRQIKRGAMSDLEIDPWSLSV